MKFPTSESSVKIMKKQYFKKLKSVSDPSDIVSLPLSRLGHPLLLGKRLDMKVIKYIHALRLAGSIVNHSM